jgi:hypothetical protein
MELGHQAKILGFLRRQDLAHEHEISGTVQPQQQRVNDVEAVAGNLARDIEMAGILEGRVLGRNDDVAHQRQLGMTHGRPVDDADHRDLDIQHPCHDPFRVPVGPVEQVGGDVARYLAVERPPRLGLRPAEGVAGSGKYDDPGLAIGADLGKGIDQLRLHGRPPFDRTAVGMDRHLQDPIAALQLHGFVFVGVAIEQ